MKKNIYTREEFLHQADLEHEKLAELEELKMISAVGYTDEGLPLYSESALEQVIHIQRLMELGYELDEIQKIVKKIGLPKTGNPAAEKGKVLTVGALAEQAGVSPRTIKHWEDKGIIEPDMRSEGGFRLYAERYIHLCNLIKDLQLFGYTLDEIKVISDIFRGFLEIQNDSTFLPKAEVENRLNIMNREIDILFDKIILFKDGIDRWENLLKKKRKEIRQLRHQNSKKTDGAEGTDNAEDDLHRTQIA